MSRDQQLRRVPAFVGKTSDLRSHNDAQGLVGWLNLKQPYGAEQVTPSNVSEQRAITRQLRALKSHQRKAERAITILREVSAIAVLGKEWPTRAKQLAGELDRIIKPLQRLRWRLPRTQHGRLYLDQTWSGDANYGLLLVARLSERGLDRVRQCRCGKWFVAYSRRNRSCSKHCKKAFEAEQRKTPEGRKKRREYMKWLRARKKGRESKRREKS